jgi:hypothetical protein
MRLGHQKWRTSPYRCGHRSLTGFDIGWFSSVSRARKRRILSSIRHRSYVFRKTCCLRAESRHLASPRTVNITAGRAQLLKLFVREPDVSGIDKSITVEFGQTINYAMTQSTSEAWSLGELEKLKPEIGRFQRFYATRAVGVGTNQFMLVCTLVFLPSLPSLLDRAILMGGVLALARLRGQLAAYKVSSSRRNLPW